MPDLSKKAVDYLKSTFRRRDSIFAHIAFRAIEISFDGTIRPDHVIHQLFAAGLVETYNYSVGGKGHLTAIRLTKAGEAFLALLPKD